jgi:hypothetical protein
VRALCRCCGCLGVALLLLIGPSPILFDEGEFIGRDVPAVQKKLSIWPQQLIDKSSLMPTFLSKSEIIIYASSNIWDYCLSASDYCFTDLNFIMRYGDSATEIMPYGFPRWDQNAGLGRRGFSASLVGTVRSSLVDDFVELPIGSHQNNCYVWVYEYCWSTARVRNHEMERNGYSPVFVKKQWGQDLWRVNGYPWSIGGGEFIPHGFKLALHDEALFAGVMGADPNGRDTNKARKPKTQKSKSLPTPIAFLLGSLLIVGSVKLLFYALDRGNNLLYPYPARAGCFLSDPPSIFGFSIG